MEFLLALQFLTRVPVTIEGKVTEENLARSMAYYPLVGLLLGVISAAVYYGISSILPSGIADFIVIGFWVIITGNMHLDALMDTADGFFSGKPKEGILAIMKDSRVGSHGVAAGILSLAGKIICLGYLPISIKIPALILIPMFGRWALVFGSAVYPYARSEGGTGTFTDLVGKRELAWASAIVLVTAIALFKLTGLIMAGLVLLFTLALGAFIKNKIGGITGDTLGATNECIELFLLLILPALV